MPTGPSSEIPPRTEKRTRIEGKLAPFPITSGVKKLSIIPTKIAAQIKRPTADVVSPVTKRKIIAGTDTKAVPKVGRREVTAATTPHKAALGIPKSQNQKPKSAP